MSVVSIKLQDVLSISQAVQGFVNNDNMSVHQRFMFLSLYNDGLVPHINNYTEMRQNIIKKYTKEGEDFNYDLLSDEDKASIENDISTLLSQDVEVKKPKALLLSHFADTNGKYPDFTYLSLFLPLLTDSSVSAY